MSAQILLLNPRHKKRRSNRRRRARRSNRRRAQPAGLRRYQAARRRRRPNRRHKGRYYMRARRSNRRRVARRPRRHYARRANRRFVRRSNRLRLPGMGSIKGMIVPAVVGAGGALLIDYAWSHVTAQPMVPAALKSGWGGIAAKAGVALGLGALGFKFARGQRKMVAYMVGGALTVQALGVIRSLMNGQPLSGYIDYQAYNLPGTRMGGYMRSGPAMLGDLGDWFSPAAVIQPPGTAVPQQFGGYMRPSPAMGGYIAAQPHVMGGGMGGYDWQNDGM